MPKRVFKSKKAYVKLLGYLKDRSIIVTAPTLGGRRLDLVESDIVLVRGFSGVNAYAFRAIITRVCRLPFDYVHLSFPDAVFGRSVRQSHRVRTELEAKIIASTPAQTEPATAQVVDLSGLGALISSSQTFDPTHPLRLSVPLTLHGNRVEVEVEGSIVSHRTEASNGAPVQSYGLKFTKTDPHDAMLLNAYVYQQIVDRPDSVR